VAAASSWQELEETVQNAIGPSGHEFARFNWADHRKARGAEAPKILRLVIGNPSS